MTVREIQDPKEIQDRNSELTALQMDAFMLEIEKHLKTDERMKVEVLVGDVEQPEGMPPFRQVILRAVGRPLENAPKIPRPDVFTEENDEAVKNFWGRDS